MPGILRRKHSALNRLATPLLQGASRDSRHAIGSAGSIAERQKIDLQVTSLPKLLRHEDRNSMAHSVESRLPFLDYRLVELAVRCPTSMKLRDGWSKWLLRESLAGTLPDEVRLRKSKLGFNTPEKAWMQQGLRNGHGNLCNASNIHLDRLIDPQKLASECRAFLASTSGSLPSETLFRALSLQTWAKVHQVS
jgi:asparagine synthase (glutamine-hydrolysing)